MVQVLSTLREDSEQMQKQLRDIREKKAAIDVAKGNIQSALADLKNMNARDPMTWVGDHWFSGAEGERQSVLSRLLEVQDLLVATGVKFAQVERLLKSLLEICEHCSRYLAVVAQHVALIPTMHAMAQWGHIEVMSGVTGSITIGIVVLVAEIVALCSGAGILAAGGIGILGVVALLIGGVITGKQRQKQFRELLRQADESWHQVSASKAQIEDVEAKLLGVFEDIQRKLQSSGYGYRRGVGDVGTHLEEIKQEFRRMTQDMQAVGIACNMYVRLLEPMAEEEAASVAVLALEHHFVWLDAAKKRQLLKAFAAVERCDWQGDAFTSQDFLLMMRQAGVDVDSLGEDILDLIKLNAGLVLGSDADASTRAPEDAYEVLPLPEEAQKGFPYAPY